MKLTCYHLHQFYHDSRYKEFLDAIASSSAWDVTSIVPMTHPSFNDFSLQILYAIPFTFDEFTVIHSLTIAKSVSFIFYFNFRRKFRKNCHHKQAIILTKRKLVSFERQKNHYTTNWKTITNKFIAEKNPTRGKETICKSVMK